MGLFLVLRCNPSPPAHRANNRLAARMDVHVLDGHLLLALAAMAVECVEQRGETAGKLVRLAEIFAAPLE
jgi:hypothetical protein